MIRTLDLVALLAGSAARDAAWLALLEGRALTWLPLDRTEVPR